jgi:hypothetical protein
MMPRSSGNLCQLARILLSSPSHGRLSLFFSQPPPRHQG